MDFQIVFINFGNLSPVQLLRALKDGLFCHVSALLKVRRRLKLLDFLQLELKNLSDILQTHETDFGTRGFDIHVNDDFI